MPVNMPATVPSAPRTPPPPPLLDWVCVVWVMLSNGDSPLFEAFPGPSWCGMYDTSIVGTPWPMPGISGSVIMSKPPPPDPPAA